jgi:DNA-binding response OmpR family regulator
MTPPPYVILATAFHDNARVLDAVSGGVDDFLRKPLVLDELEVRMLAASRLIRALRMVARVQENLRGR